jgi:hypothetical protein
MPRQRVVETDSGIQGEFIVTVYDEMQRRLRDKGWIETKDIIESGITKGLALVKSVKRGRWCKVLKGDVGAKGNKKRHKT